MIRLERRTLAWGTGDCAACEIQNGVSVINRSTSSSCSTGSNTYLRRLRMPFFSFVIDSKCPPYSRRSQRRPIGIDFYGSKSHQAQKQKGWLTRIQVWLE